MRPSQTLVVGIGSSHGDDRVGWEIADAVLERVDGRAEVRRARKPADLLDWLEGIASLEVCDAVAGEIGPGCVRSWVWPAAEIAGVPFAGSHDLSLVATLALAEQLGRLPAHVRIWGVGVHRVQAWSPMSPAVAAAVDRAVEQICAALDVARAPQP
ncbi:MAG: hypothetical protein DWQ37_16805 [Planctomycetota bacterium]|nr:MAG: hypothetical protein DWQ37_16805 [Planctomycetota bacterium]